MHLRRRVHHTAKARVACIANDGRLGLVEEHERRQRTDVHDRRCVVAVTTLGCAAEIIYELVYPCHVPADCSCLGVWSGRLRARTQIAQAVAVLSVHVAHVARADAEFC